MKSLAEYLHALSTDTDALDRFKENPPESIRKAGLSEAAQEALLSGESAQIRAAIVKETGPAESPAEVTFIIVLVHVNVVKPIFEE